MRLAAALAIGLLLSGCAGAAPRPAEAPEPAPAAAPKAAQPGRVVLPRTIITPDGAVDVAELYDRAFENLQQGHPVEAARGFDRVAQVDPDGPYAPDALYQSAIAHEQAGDRETSLERFEQLTRRFPKNALARQALIRSIRLLCFLERWARAGEAAQLFLTRYTDADPFESVVALSGRALAQLAKGDVDGATYYVEKGRTIVEDHRLDAAGAIPRDLAQLYYALGEARRIRAERIHFDPVPTNFAQVLEERCQLLLDAQSAYSDTMRAYDAHWSAMAGYRVGELYQKLHEDLMAMPRPATADTDARRQLFEGAMRLRYSVLLDKALAMMEHTLTMSARTGEKSAWVEKAQAAKEALQKAQRAEQAALDKLPYTRADLQAALDDLARKTQTPPTAP
jgi:tetratricopeptide (TPR) repeat protein